MAVSFLDISVHSLASICVSVGHGIRCRGSIRSLRVRYIGMDVPVVGWDCMGTQRKFTPISLLPFLNLLVFFVSGYAV